MPDFNPKELAKMIEDYLGQRLGRIVIVSGIFAGALFVLSTAFYWFEQAVGLTWRAAHSVFGIANEGITLGNIELIIGILVATIAFFVCFFVLAVVVFIRTIKRRTIPQKIIDQLSDLRSDGITLMNNGTNIARNEESPAWIESWREWRDQVIAILNRGFTRTEQLMFTRLGFFPAHEPVMPGISREHVTSIRNLIRELEILEALIGYHQARH